MAQPAALPPPWAKSGYLTEEEAALYIRTPVETLRKWRRLGIGPIAIKQPNGRVFYPEHLLEEWKAELIKQAIAEAEQRQPGAGRVRRRRASRPEQPGGGLQAMQRVTSERQPPATTPGRRSARAHHLAAAPANDRPASRRSAMTAEAERTRS